MNIRIFKKLCIGLLLLLPLISVAAKKGYEIKVKVSDLKDTVVYLANYFGEKTYLTDTAVVEAGGRFVFVGDEPLPGGIYIVAAGKTRLFEFLIEKSQFPNFETMGPDYIKNMKIKNSPENQQFYDYMQFNAGKYMEAEPLQKLMKNTKNADSTEMLRKKLEDLNKEVEGYKYDFMSKNPGTLMANFFNLMREVELPPPPVKADGTKDSVFLYRYFKTHYWDNVDLNDDRLLRTPVFHGKIVQYFDKVILQHPDTLIVNADYMIEKVRANKEMFKYFIWYLTNWSETSNVMGFDKIFVHMVETYYMTKQAFWTNATVVENLTKKALKLKKILIGEIAPNMIMLDTNMMPQSMAGINAKYTVLYFWDPECGHCKTESPKLKKLYDDVRSKYNLEVFAVCADTNMRKMKEYIVKNNFTWLNVNGPRTITQNYHDLYDVYSTPVIYLLDDKKKILAKRLMTDQLASFLERWDAEMIRKEKEGK